MKRILDINPSLNQKIEEIIKSKSYRDFQQFSEIAFENQVTAEMNQQNSWEISTYETNASDSKIIQRNGNENTLLNVDNPMLIEAPIDDKLIGKILWGQFYRFLPLKVATRVLANLSKNTFPTIDEFIKICVDTAVLFNKKLIRIDKKENRSYGERISASFPDGSKKSILRFQNQYLFYLRKNDHKIDGFLARMKFCNIVSKDNTKIGLTSFGKNFAILENPLIDKNITKSLSKEEIDFLINHIITNLPFEAEHMFITLQLLQKKINSPTQLNVSLRQYYNKNYSGEKWTDIVINTMRSGILGRLIEMDLIFRKKIGKNATYHLTKDGEHFIERYKSEGNKSYNINQNQNHTNSKNGGYSHISSEKCFVVNGEMN